MKRKILFIISACVLAVSSFSQSDYKTYDLSNFKLPKLKRQKFEINGSFSSDQNVKHRKSNEGGDTLDYSKLEYQLFPNYNFYYYDRKFLINQQVRGSFYGYKQDRGGVADNDFPIKHNASFNYSGDAKYYFSEFYVGAGVGFGFARSKSEEKISSSSSEEDAKTRNINYVASGEFGYGRIEPVNDARLAIYIIEALEKEGVLSACSSADLNELAEYISYLRNERMFDFREKEIWEMEELFSFLEKKGLLKGTNIRTYAKVKDLWQFADNYTRFSGKQIYLKVRGRKSNFKWKVYEGERLTNHDESNDFNKELELGFKIVKPIKHHFEWSANAVGVYRFNESERMDKLYGGEDESEDKVYSVNMNSRIAYVPNTRSAYQLGLAYSYRKYDASREPGGREFEQKGSNFSIGGSMNYYLSPQVRLTGELAYYFNNAEQEYNGYNNSDFNSKDSRFHVKLGLVCKIL